MKERYASIKYYTLCNILFYREPYSLRIPLALWSFSLAIFSIIGTLRTWPEFLHSFGNKGLHYTVCDPR